MIIKLKNEKNKDTAKVNQSKLRGFSFIEDSTIDYIDSLLKRVQHARLNPKFALRGFVSNP